MAGQWGIQEKPLDRVLWDTCGKTPGFVDSNCAYVSAGYGALSHSSPGRFWGSEDG